MTNGYISFIMRTTNKCSGGKNMLQALGFTTLFEIALVVFVLWAIFNEDKFIAFEKRIFSYVRRRKLKVVKPSVKSTEKMFGEQYVPF